MTQKRNLGINSKWRIGLLAIIISILIIVFGLYSYRNQVNKVRDEKDNELASISKLKIAQLIQWQKERIGDAFVLSHSLVFVNAVDQWLHNKNNKYFTKDVKEYLSLSQQAYSYKNICLSSIQGELLFSVGLSEDHFDAFTSKKISEAVTFKKITCTDFYYSKEGDKIKYDIIAPKMLLNLPIPAPLNLELRKRAATLNFL